MSMRNIITITVILLLVFCNTGCTNGISIKPEASDSPESVLPIHNNSIREGTADGDAGDDEDEVDPIDLKKYEFKELPVCNFSIDEDSGSCLYEEGNEMLYITCVEETPAAFRMEIEFNYFKQNLEYVELLFRTGDKKQKVKLGYVVSGSNYSIKIDRNDSDSFQLCDARWKFGKFELSESLEFGGNIEVIGYNTLKYKFTNKTIVLCRKDDTIIGVEHLRWFGKKAINFGAYYYKVVI